MLSEFGVEALEKLDVRWPIVGTVIREEEILQIPSHPLAECSLFGRGVLFEVGYDALKVGEIRREFPGSLFEHCELPFGSSLAVWVVVGTV